MVELHYDFKNFCWFFSEFDKSVRMSSLYIATVYTYTFALGNSEENTRDAQGANIYWFPDKIASNG